MHNHSMNMYADTRVFKMPSIVSSYGESVLFFDDNHDDDDDDNDDGSTSM